MIDYSYARVFGEFPRSRGGGGGDPGLYEAVGRDMMTCIRAEVENMKKKRKKKCT